MLSIKYLRINLKNVVKPIQIIFLLFLAAFYTDGLNALRFNKSGGSERELPPEHQEENPRIPNDRGTVIYPSYYQLNIYPVVYKLSDTKLYLPKIIKTVIHDRLKLLVKAYIPDPIASRIYYPLQSDKVTAEDRLEEALLKSPPPDHFYPIKIYSASLKPRVADPERLATTQWEHLSLASEEFHLFIAIEEYQHDHYLITYTLVFRQKVLAQDRLETTEDEIIESVERLAIILRSKISGGKTGSIRVESPVEGVSVYLNDTYIGKTPVETKELTIGRYRLLMKKEGYTEKSRNIEILEGKTTRVKDSLDLQIEKGEVTIYTAPGEAEVYLDVTYAGKTPLSIKDIPSGIHRIRISKPGYIDKYLTVDISQENFSKEFNVQLRKGNNERFYTVNRPVLGKLTNNHLYSSFLGLSILTGGAALYLWTQEKSMVSELELLNSQTTLTPFETSRIATLQKLIPRYRTYHTAGFITSGVSITLAVYFFIRLVSSRDLPVALDQPDERYPGQTSLRKAELNLFITPAATTGVISFHF